MKIKLARFLILGSLALFMSVMVHAQTSWDESFTALQKAEKEGQLELAQSLLNQTLDQAENTYGKKHQAYVFTLHLGVKLSFKTEQYEEGLDLAKEELQLMNEVSFDQQTQFYIQLLNFLSQLNLQTNNISEAISYAKDYMEVLQQEDKNSLNHALAIYDYASLLYQNNEEDALTYFQEALPILNQHIAQVGTQYLYSLYYVATLLQEDGILDESANYFDKVIGITQDNNLQSSDLWKFSAYQRALIYQEQSQNDKAISFYEILVTQLENDEDTDREIYGSAQNNLGVLYQKTGQNKKGESLLVLSGNDLQSQLNSAAVAFNKGEYAIALSLYTAANDSLNINSQQDSLQSAKILAQKALVYNTMGQLDSALQLLLYVEDKILNNISGINEEKALVYKNTGDLYLELANFDSAGLYLDKALKQFEGNSNFKSEIEIQTRNSLGVLEQNKTNVEEAASYFTENLKLIEDVLGKQTVEYANTLNNLGALRLENGNYGLAESNFKDAGFIFNAIFDQNHENNAKVYENLGTVAQSRSQFRKADSLFQLAEKTYITSLGKSHPSLLNVYSKLALVKLAEADYPTAEQYFRKTVDLSKTVFGSQSVAHADALSGMGLYYQSTGNLKEAKSNLEKAIATYTEKLGKIHPSYVSSIENLSSIFQTEGNVDQALPLLNEALELDSIIYGVQHPKYATTLHNLASLYLTNEDYEKAEDLYEKSLVIDEAVYGRENPTFASTQYNLAVLYQKQGKHVKADSLFAKVTKLRRDVLGENHPDYIFTLYGWGILKQVENEIDSAYALFNSSVKSYLFLFKEYFPSMSESEKSAFYHKVNPVFEAYKDFAIENYEAIPKLKEDLFDLQLTTKAMLLNASAKMRNKILNSGDQELVILFQNWQDKKEKAIQYYSYTKEELLAQSIDLEHLEASINNMEKELSIKSNLFNAGFGSDSINWKKLQQSLASNTGVVELVRVKKSLKNDSIVYAGLILTDTMDEPEIAVLQEGRRIEKQYFNAYQNLIKFKLMDKISYENLWEWVDEKIPEGLDKLFISPDGIYNKININTLYSEHLSQYLLEKENIRIITSSRDLIKNRKPKANSIDKIQANESDFHEFPSLVLIGSPDFSLGRPADEMNLEAQNVGLMRNFTGGIPALPGTKIEINAIDSMTRANNWSVKKYLDEEANEILIDSLTAPNILHIATHGFFKAYNADNKISGVENQGKEENPLLRSGILLSGASIGLAGGLPYENSFEDGLLTAYETMNLNLDATELVVLSACETGLGDVKNGEGVYGLQRAFLVAGAENLIMSLWTVNDYTTQLLMTEFYKNWTEGDDKFTSFRKAQMKIKEEFPQPYYWAAFTIIGE
ncbi:CHAT domain-containing tetratricopeptide repeat protein [Marivirga harenae]|uniref:CHAT domain-containing tetratricopeptide repeat protein n=1 Tax=Marivirga harenae TaxID=2010992 RepID=UPI0026E0D1F1|nr:CHAT domain-containing protein [Marivirga harenae]WKV11015.1 tetratricopeptide repeat protein [Marivirga harenae]